MVQRHNTRNCYEMLVNLVAYVTVGQSLALLHVIKKKS